MAIKTVIDDGYFFRVYNTDNQLTSCKPHSKDDKLLNVQGDFWVRLYGGRIITMNEQGLPVSDRWA